MEVQCSSLPISRLQLRTQAYREAGYLVLLVAWQGFQAQGTTDQFGTSNFFSMNMGFHLWELDDEKELRLRYLIHEDLRGKVHYLTKVFSIWRGKFIGNLASAFAKQILSSMICTGAPRRSARPQRRRPTGRRGRKTTPQSPGPWQLPSMSTTRMPTPHPTPPPNPN